MGYELNKSLAANIKKLRSIKAISQAVLAEKSNVSTSYLSQMEQAMHFPSGEVLESLAKVLDVEVFELLMSETQAEEYQQLQQMRTFYKTLADQVIQEIKERLPRGKGDQS